MGGSEQGRLEHQHIFLAVELPPLIETSFKISQLTFELHTELLQPFRNKILRHTRCKEMTEASRTSLIE